MPDLIHADDCTAIPESRRPSSQPDQSRAKAETGNDLVRTALTALTEPLAQFLAARMHARYGPSWASYALGAMHASAPMRRTAADDLGSDLCAIVGTITSFWQSAFSDVSATSRFARTYLEEIRQIRNRLAHGAKFTTADAMRAVDTAYRVLGIVGDTDRSSLEAMRTRLVRRWACQGSGEPFHATGSCGIDPKAMVRGSGSTRRVGLDE
jgi:hypothetical protein